MQCRGSSRTQESREGMKEAMKEGRKDNEKEKGRKNEKKKEGKKKTCMRQHDGNILQWSMARRNTNI